MHDLDTDIYAEPTFSGRMPDAPVRYAEVPWVVQFYGDSVYNKAPWKRVSSQGSCPPCLKLSLYLTDINDTCHLSRAVQVLPAASLL